MSVGGHPALSHQPFPNVESRAITRIITIADCAYNLISIVYLLNYYRTHPYYPIR